MGKKRKSKKQYQFDDFFSPPATNPFGEEEEATFESQFLGDLIDSGSTDVDFDFDSNEFSGMQTDASFPDWNPQPEQVTPVKEEPRPTQQPFRKPDRSWNGDGQAVYEYDVALHLAKTFPMGLYQNNPYIKIDGVDVALDSKLVGSLIDKSINVLQKRKISGQSFKYIFAWLQAILDGSGRILERDPYWIPFENGVYDLRNNRYIHPSMLTNKFFPARIHASFYPDEECPATPAWDAFLESCTGGNPEIRQLILEYLGYMLAPCDPDQIILFAPVAGSGKSALARFCRSLLGMDKTCAIALSNFGKSFEVAQIYGKVGNFCMDISGAVLSDATVATLKRLSGGDPETINAKYRDPFPYTNYAKLTFGCNEGGIRLRNHDSGMDRRLVVIPFLHAVPKHKMDKQLNEKLWAERDGIVWHAMNALKTLHRNGYNFSYCREGELLKRKYLGVGEASVQDFIDDFCTFTPNEQEWTSTLYDAYLAYCLENEMDPVGRKRFAQIIYAIPGVQAQKFQKDHTQLQGARGISLRPL